MEVSINKVTPGVSKKRQKELLAHGNNKKQTLTGFIIIIIFNFRPCTSLQPASRTDHT